MFISHPQYIGRRPSLASLIAIANHTVDLPAPGNPAVTVVRCGMNPSVRFRSNSSSPNGNTFLFTRRAMISAAYDRNVSAGRFM